MKPSDASRTDLTNTDVQSTKLMHLSMLCRPGGGGGRGWGWDLIVFVGPGVGHLTDLVEVGSKLTTLFIYFFHSQNQRAKAAMYLAAGSFVFA